MVRDAEGHIIIRAISNWVIFDIQTREIRKSELIAIHFPNINKEREIDCRLGKLKPCGPLEIAYKKVIGYSDIDFNGHLNNSKYIDFIMDCFSMERHKQYSVKAIEVTYINEALPGETLVLSMDVSALDSNQIYIEGVNDSGDKGVFKALIVVS